MLQRRRAPCSADLRQGTVKQKLRVLRSFGEQARQKLLGRLEAAGTQMPEGKLALFGVFRRQESSA
jgi:hypothetical protein